jgi:hypothetical protein
MYRHDYSQKMQLTNAQHINTKDVLTEINTIGNTSEQDATTQYL